MAQSGFWGGLGTGFQSGLDSGIAWQDTQTRRQALMQKLADEKVEMGVKLVEQQLENVDQLSSSIINKDTNSESSIAAIRAQIDDTVNGIGAIKTEKAQMMKQGLSSIINAKWGLITRTGPERKSAEIAQAQSAAQMEYGQAFPGMAQPPQVAPSPSTTQSATQAATPGAAQGPVAGAMAQAEPVAPPPDPSMLAQAGAAEPPMASPGMAQEPTAPEAPAPLVGNLYDLVQTDEIPARDIEMLVANPEKAAPVFQQAYGGIDTSSLFTDPDAPGSKPSFEDFYLAKQGIEIPGRKELAAQQAKDYPGKLKSINEARQQIRVNFGQRKLIRQGIYEGWFGPWEFEAAKVGQEFSHDPQIRGKIARTEALIGGARSKAAVIIKNFGAGTGLSDADLKFAFQLAAGDIAMTSESLERLLDIDTRTALSKITSPTSEALDALAENRARLTAAGVRKDQIDRLLGE